MTRTTLLFPALPAEDGELLREAPRALGGEADSPRQRADALRGGALPPCERSKHLVAARVPAAEVDAFVKSR